MEKHGAGPGIVTARVRVGLGLAVLLILLAQRGVAAAPDSPPVRDGTCAACRPTATVRMLPSDGCGCHTDGPWYHHPVGVQPSTQLRARIPADLPLLDGRVVCTTCHDPVATCTPTGAQTEGLRHAPFASRTDACFLCHDASAYTRRNTHDQVDAKGRIVEKTCLYCHTQTPKRGGSGELRLVGEITGLCVRCHQVGAHPGGSDHLRVPSDRIASRMTAIEEEYNIKLPLDDTGAMSCVTCHNPHERGVLPVGDPNARGASEKQQLRLPGILCDRCHQK